MKLRILTSAICMAVTLMAATATDYIKVNTSAIKAQVQSNPSQRASLLKSFEAGEKLTPSQMEIVYYGEAFTPGYKEVKGYPEIDKMLKNQEYDKALNLINVELKKNPVSLTLICDAFLSSKNSSIAAVRNSASKYVQQIQNICDLIYASAKGVTLNDPYMVLSESDANAFVFYFLQPESIIDSAHIDGMDAIKIKWPGQTEPGILYFGRPK